MDKKALGRIGVNFLKHAGVIAACAIVGAAVTNTGKDSTKVAGNLIKQFMNVVRNG